MNEQVELVEDAEVIETTEVATRDELTAQALPSMAEDEVALLRARYKLAEQIAKTEFVPSSMRGKPAVILACFFAGKEVGLGPMASLQHIAIIDGRPNLSAELQSALVRKAGHSIEGSSTATEATFTGTRKDTGDTMTVTWTLETALTAGLIDKIEDGKPVKKTASGRSSVWEKYPHSMLAARAVTQLCGQLFSDVMIGGLPGDVE